MCKATPIVVAFVVLGIAQCTPIRGEWTLEASKSFMADRRGQMHPCCPNIMAILEQVETPAVVCAYYTNNLKKKNKGRVGVRSAAWGLESGAFLGEWRSSGSVHDNSWVECAYLGRAPEPCLLDFEFSLAGFPRMKRKPRHTDGFSAGMFAIPGAEAADAKNGRALLGVFRERRSTATGDP